MILLVWLTSPSERNRREQMDRISTGDSMARVAEILGPPTVRCPVGDLSHFARSFPPGWPAASLETTLQTLEEETGERWVYALDPDDGASCAPADDRSELGLDAEGRVLWYVAITGESPIELPSRFSPAAAGENE